MTETRAGCGACGTETIHWDGVCQLCEHRRQAAATAAPPAKQEERHIKVPIKTLVLLAALVAIVGKIHLVHGGNVLSVCEKDGWTLNDTFVDLDDYIGKPLIANIDKARVLRAMFACKVLERPSFLDERH